MIKILNGIIIHVCTLACFVVHTLRYRNHLAWMSKGRKVSLSDANNGSWWRGSDGGGRVGSSGGESFGCIATLCTQQAFHFSQDVLPIRESAEVGGRVYVSQDAIQEGIRKDIQHLLNHIIGKLILQQWLKSTLHINLIQDHLTILEGTKEDTLFNHIGGKLVTTKIKDLWQ